MDYLYSIIFLLTQTKKAGKYLIVISDKEPSIMTRNNMHNLFEYPETNDLRQIMHTYVKGGMHV